MRNIGFNHFQQQKLQASANQHKAQNAEGSEFKLVNKILQAAQNNANSIMNNFKQNVLAQSEIINTQKQLSQLNSIEKSMLVKDLMNLPKDFKNLVSLLTTQLQSTNFTKKPISQFDFAKLINLLMINGKEAQNKIFLLMGELNKVGIKSSQIKELSFIINACVPSASVSNNQVLKNIMLLYLPWLPIGQENSFEVEIQANKEEEEKNSDDNSISILIQTVNFGNIKVLLTLETGNNVKIFIDCSKDFPKKDLETKIKDEARKNNVNAGMNFSEIKQQEKISVDNVKVNLNSTSSVNPFLILMAHATIKLIIEIDKNYELIKIRKTKIQE